MVVEKEGGRGAGFHHVDGGGGGGSRRETRGL